MADIEQAFEAIKRSYDAGRMAHAFLLLGAAEPGGAARVLAERVLTMLYCQSDGVRPCGVCVGCRQAAEHTYPDMVWIEPESKSRMILKEQGEQIQGHIAQTAFIGGWKAVVLMNADRLHAVVANQLLKTLEEPPPKSLFLLVTDRADDVMPTIVSRCQRIIVGGGVTDDESLKPVIVELMTSVPGDGVLPGIMRARLLADLLKKGRKPIETEEKELAGLDSVDGELREKRKKVMEARVDARYKKVRESILRWLLLWHRDLLLCLHGAGDEQLCFPESAEAVRAAAASLTYRQAMGNIRVVEEMKGQLEQNLPEGGVLERAFIALRGCVRKAEAARRGA